MTIAVTCDSPDRMPGRFELYCKAVEGAGGEAVFVFSDANVKDIGAAFDGFLIPGGRDIDPSHYGEDSLLPCVPEKIRRTDFEISLLREIMDLRKPVLGICYGMQLMNVFLGGSLYQDIASQRGGALDHREGMHLTTICENPFLGEGRVETNSSHHQAVKRTGRGIRFFASASDGIIEAFYLEQHPFFLGVQWHPERMDVPLSDLIFMKFVGACRANQ